MTNIHTVPLDMAYDEDTAAEAASRLSQQFGVQVEIVEESSSIGWPLVVISGRADRVVHILAEAWSIDGDGLNEHPYEFLEIDCPKVTCDGTLGRIASGWATCQTCDLNVDVDALVEPPLDEQVEETSTEITNSLQESGLVPELVDLALEAVDNRNDHDALREILERMDLLLH